MIKYSVMNINILRKKLHMPMMNRLTFMDGADLTDFTLESVIEIVNVLEGEAMMDRSWRVCMWSLMHLIYKYQICQRYIMLILFGKGGLQRWDLPHIKFQAPMDTTSQSSKPSHDKSPYFQLLPKGLKWMLKRTKKRKRKRWIVGADSRAILFQVQEYDVGTNRPNRLIKKGWQVSGLNLPKIVPNQA